MIKQSVGSRGINDHNDTLIIQCALNVTRAHRGLAPIVIDGLVGPITIGAILAFQRSNPPLAQDGRIDAGGPTLAALTASIGSEEFVFGPVVQELLAIKAEFDKLMVFAPPRVRRPLTRVMPGLSSVSKFSDLAKGLPPARTPALAAFHGGAPKFGFVGVDDAAAALSLAMLALMMALMLVLIIQSPVFRDAVRVRAKELDRIMSDLRINASVGLKDSVDIIEAIFSETKDAEQRCRQSPTFTPSPECSAAMQEFAKISAALRALMPRLIKIVTTILDYVKFPNSGLNIQQIRVDFNRLLVEAQKLAFELQLALADMQEKCKCPE